MSAASLDLTRLLPENEIPRQETGIPNLLIGRPAKLQWYGRDDEEHYQSNDIENDPVYGRNTPPLSYELNSRGYRCPEFSETADIRIAVFGCSISFGVGLRREELYHEIFASHLAQRLKKSVVNLNLSVSGGSNDQIARLLPCAVEILKPQIIVILFPPKARRECIEETGTSFNVNPRMTPTRRRKEKFAAVTALSSAYDDLLNLYSASILARHLDSRCAMLCLLEPEASKLPAWLMRIGEFAGTMPYLDTARDRAHPGPRSHKALADKLIRSFEEKLEASPRLLDGGFAA